MGEVNMEYTWGGYLMWCVSENKQDSKTIF